MYLERVLHNEEELGDSIRKGSTYAQLIVAYYMLGNYNQALKYAKYYLSIAKELGDKEQEGRAYRYLISPISNLIKDGELIVVPDGPLCLAPFAAFLDSESKYLSESMRIRILRHRCV